MDLPVSFEVKPKGTSEKAHCQVYLLDNSHSLQVEELQGYILETLEDKEFLFPLTPTEFNYILSGEGGFALGAFVENRLIGFMAVYFPRDHDDNLGRDLGFFESELRQVVHLEVCFVHPDYRGNSLQKKMGQVCVRLLLKQISMLKEVRHLFSTVMPTNTPSMISMFAQKMKIIGLKQKYNNSWRYIFYRDLWAEDDDEERRMKKEPISLSSLDFPGQLLLLNQGYQGIGYRRTEAGVEVLYVKNG